MILQIPVREHDQELAHKLATRLATYLAVTVDADRMAELWLARPVTKRRRPHRRFADAVVGQQVRSGLSSVMPVAWREAWHLGWDSGLHLLGDGGQPVHNSRSAESVAQLTDLERSSLHRARLAARTRLRYLGTVLDHAAPDVPAARLAADIRAELGSVPLALRVTQTEVTWAANRAAAAVYGLAGATTVAWATDEDTVVCGDCAANEAEGLITAGRPFISGHNEPPAHPFCRCMIIPGATRGWSPVSG